MTACTDVFLSHNWGNDECGRNNHQRVSLINEELKARGYKTWFDEEKMTGNIDKKMARGIERTKGVIVFITRKYYEKVNGIDAGDNCQKEFQHASKIKTSAKMVPVAMEKLMCDSTPWEGLVGINLGGEMYVDMSGDIENETYLSQQMELLSKELQSKGIHPKQGKLSFNFQYYVEKTAVPFSAEYPIKHYEMLTLPLLDVLRKCLLTI